MNELSLTRRVRFHARIALALEKQHGEKTDGHAAELAFHFEAAQAILGVEKLVHYSLMAAESALARLAAEDALAHSEKGLAALADAPDSDSKAELWWVKARALSALGESGLGQVAEPFKKAFSYYLSTGNRDRALHVAGFVFGAVTPAFSAERVDVLKQAIELAEPGSIEYARVAGAYGYALHSSGIDPVGYERYIHEAVEVAGRENDVGLERLILGQFCTTLWQSGRFAEAQEIGGQVLARKTQAADAADWRANVGLAHSALAAGDLAGAMVHTLRSLEVARSRRDLRMEQTSGGVTFSVCIAGGEWARAIEVATPRPGRPDLHPSEKEMIEFLTGNNTDLRRIVAEPARQWVQWIAYSMFGTLRGRLTPEIRGIVERTLRPDRSPVRPFWADVIASLTGGTFGVDHDDRALVETCYRQLEGLSGKFVCVSIDRVLGVMAASLEKYETAESHLVDARRFCERGGYRPELAWTLHDFGDLFNARNEGNDAEKAARMWDESLVLARALGMKPLIERVLARKKFLKA